ncbi:sarcosine oxidase subunit delta [Ruegeria sp.]|uniref:sarcosine oxidase subunit delta n=1 Tax=Ruegeria sp. TaxID=1879320 RepID=UPI003B5C949A
MLLIRCPYCDEYFPELEFEYAGEAHLERPEDPSTLNDGEWKDYLFTRRNVRGLHAEQWRHAHGCGRYFNVVRDTVTDKIIATYKMGEPCPVDLNEEKING